VGDERTEAASVEFGLQLGNASFHHAAFDRDAELVHAEFQQLLV
jgi:hypothetical protein